VDRDIRQHLDALAAIVKSEIAKWAKVIKDGNSKPE
jgi:hypothetical protein